MHNALHFLISIHDPEPFKLVTNLDQQPEEFDSAVNSLYDNLHSLKTDRLLSSERSNLIKEKFKQPFLDSIDLVAIYHRLISTYLVPDLDSFREMLLPPPPIIPRKCGVG
ncbi:hypothetical protein O181_054164 [Austropuccinia psidii MF-1]|uniref:Uncharacterized protein n=1 Tax=Austropuccinia psidii MF-1 TaxID=1389203 RepID=A0A9Q3HTE0_9BASI|nr:hypothetical protein [Austropuccinia psidii MF-1]